MRPWVFISPEGLALHPTSSSWFEAASASLLHLNLHKITLIKCPLFCFDREAEDTCMYIYMFNNIFNNFMDLWLHYG